MLAVLVVAQTSLSGVCQCYHGSLSTCTLLLPAKQSLVSSISRRGLFFPAHACKWCTFLLSATFSTSCLNQIHQYRLYSCRVCLMDCGHLKEWRLSEVKQTESVIDTDLKIAKRGCLLNQSFLRHMWILIDNKLYKLRQAGGFQQPQMMSALCIIYTLVVGSCLSCAWQKAIICSLFCMKLKQM